MTFVEQYAAQLEAVREMRERTLIREAGRVCMRGVIILSLLAVFIATLPGCTTVQNTLSEIDYGCVDITIDTTVSDSGILGRGIVLPEGESLTAETVELLCEY